MKKSNLYTATGDKGTTSLVGGKRVSKTDIRLEAYGTTDELNAHIGMLVAMMPAGDDTALLHRIQDTLFVVGSALATDLETTTLHESSRLQEEEIKCVEERIDLLDSQVPPLCKFVLPGGAMAASQAHVCRTVCRRAERCICALAEVHPIADNVQRYVNRLSDYFFVLARYINHSSATPERFWGDR
ncbi:MAG: cob(I)yrinic acid a,c-diamide adenosyltransferase [Bacteroidaceae bacterium]|nr:cob(I)yrinic acid a,c-diamide adenosyltransferase [Bacteroidaceae bacterium]